MRVTTLDVQALPEVVDGVTRRISVRCEEPKCTARAHWLCDWKIGQGRGLCDALVCDGHVTHPTPGKELCKAHAAEWEKRRSSAVVAAA